MAAIGLEVTLEATLSPAIATGTVRLLTLPTLPLHSRLRVTGNELAAAAAARRRKQRFESRGHAVIDSPKVSDRHAGVRHRVQVGRRPKLRLRVHRVGPSLHLCRKNLRPPPVHAASAH